MPVNAVLVANALTYAHLRSPPLCCFESLLLPKHISEESVIGAPSILESSRREQGVRAKKK